MDKTIMKRVAAALSQEFSESPKLEIVGNLVVLSLDDGPLAVVVKRPAANMSALLATSRAAT